MNRTMRAHRQRPRGAPRPHADFKQGGPIQAGDRLRGIAIVEHDVVEGGFGDGVIGWGLR